MVSDGCDDFGSKGGDAKSFDQYFIENPETISVDPYHTIGNDKALMDILLFDNNTGSNLLWVTDNYVSEGSGFSPRDQIQYLFIIIKIESSAPDI